MADTEPTTVEEVQAEPVENKEEAAAEVEAARFSNRSTERRGPPSECCKLELHRQERHPQLRRRPSRLCRKTVGLRTTSSTHSSRSRRPGLAWSWPGRQGKLEV